MRNLAPLGKTTTILPAGFGQSTSRWLPCGGFVESRTS
ncbi:hypothetical protein SF83666_a42210 (plasmid) [Sinorhizobium fredii CCBAU 83666]|nr:hypothetical protein SF83666_a42210 [Sinorhizobium fredii CCBAU 83666]